MSLNVARDLSMSIDSACEKMDSLSAIFCALAMCDECICVVEVVRRSYCWNHPWASHRLRMLKKELVIEVEGSCRDF